MQILSTRLLGFCSSANLLCSSELGQSLEKHDKDSSFSSYASKNFTNYGSDRLGGADSAGTGAKTRSVPHSSTTETAPTAGVEEFKSYRENPAQGEDSFQSYAKDSKNEVVTFANYGESFRFGEDNFTSYGKGATGQSIGFKVCSDLNQFKEYTKDKKGVTFATYNVTHKNYATTTTTAMAGWTL
ncbi:hypothetical protein L484_027778 [Morus notabilis]|uniref:BURP domain-containing protein n=1 Tax=Morus notabilis TaxID=981085 RepID=W9RKU5_9ROSA|nr:hypothetical protein L484_027778 [Morus notabilis]